MSAGLAGQVGAVPTYVGVGWAYMLFELGLVELVPIAAEGEGEAVDRPLLLVADMEELED